MDHTSLKDEGNSRFAANDFTGAALSYSSAIERLMSSLASGAQQHAVITATKALESALRSPAGKDFDEGVADASAVVAQHADGSILALLLSNRAQARMKCGEFEHALKDVSLAALLDPGSVKAAYRRALCLKSLGRPSEAAREAGRILSLDKNNSAASALLRTLREESTLGGVALHSSSPGSSAVPGWGLAHCLSMLRGAHPLPLAWKGMELDTMLDMLQRDLVSAGPVRAFLGDEPGRGGLSALLALALRAENKGMQRCANMLLKVVSQAAESYCGEWQKEWQAAAAPASPIPSFPTQQSSVIDGCLLAVSTYLTPHIARDGSKSAADRVGVSGNASTMLRLSAGILGLALQCCRGTMQACTAAALRSGKDVRAGSPSWVPFPTSWTQCVETWARASAQVLMNPLEASGADEGPVPVVLLACQAAGHVMDSCGVEAAVRAFASSSLLEALTHHVSADCRIVALGEYGSGQGQRHKGQAEDVRRAAGTALARGFSIYRDTSPRGYIAIGREKMFECVTTLMRSRDFDRLAAALPNKASGEEGQRQQPGSLSSTLEPAPEGIPDWTPGPSHALVACLLHVALLVDMEVGLDLAGRAGVLPAVFIASGHAQTEVQTVAADVVSILCGTEPGRSHLTSLPQKVVCDDPAYSARLDVVGLLTRLSESSDRRVRSTAAVTLTKLTASQPSFHKSESARGRIHVIDTTLHALEEAAGMEQNDEEGRGSTSESCCGEFKRSAEETLRGLSSGYDIPSTASAAPSTSRFVPDVHQVSRAVESAAIICVHTEAKAALTGRPAALLALVRLGGAIVAHLYMHAALMRAATSDEARGGEAIKVGGRWLGTSMKLADLSAHAKSDLSRGEIRPAALGLATILQSLVSSRQAMQERKLAEMEVDPAQWREMQRLTSPSGPEGAALGASLPGVEVDPPGDVETRCRRMVDADCLPLAAGLADAVKAAAVSAAAAVQGDVIDTRRSDGRPGPSPLQDTAKAGGAIREAVSLFLLAIAEWPWARGRLLQDGLLPTLMDLSDPSSLRPVRRGASAGKGFDSEGSIPTDSTAGGASSSALTNTGVGWQAAAQALARVLVSINPRLVPGGEGGLVDCTGPLLRLARESPSSLAQFEACLALTNLASAGEGVRASLLARGVMGAAEFLQFSSHPMVRRAGTECLANLAVTSKVARNITGKRLHLWLALASTFEKGAPVPGTVRSPAPGHIEEDTPTALAAAGGLVMAVGCEVDEWGGEGCLDVNSASEAHSLALACVARLVRGGAARTGAELLLAGSAHPGLPHRAAALCAQIARFPIGVAALLTPLSVGMELLASKEEEGDVEEGLRAVKEFTPYHLLLLATQGKDLAALARGAANSAASAPDPSRYVAGGGIDGVQRCAAATVRRVLRTPWEGVLAAVEQEAALAAALAPITRSGSSPSTSESQSGEVEVGLLVEDGCEEGEARAGKEPLVPAQPDEEHARKMLEAFGLQEDSDGDE